ncbi:hypothetical protein DFP72DRAFT_1069321 [Ephemerocybe angulata]|uniref:Uncharacterized protein n=1 Tax=Ephemerocybe angulata TaxID=980116 RepID=A0A8H6HXT6_9AGAR|nr:hypothetical protein DFP72DRAFT_1069321 [Tulosesus angulatus]
MTSTYPRYLPTDGPLPSGTKERHGVLRRFSVCDESIAIFTATVIASALQLWSSRERGKFVQFVYQLVDFAVAPRGSDTSTALPAGSASFYGGVGGAGAGADGAPIRVCAKNSRTVAWLVAKIQDALAGAVMGDAYDLFEEIRLMCYSTHLADLYAVGAVEQQSLMRLIDKSLIANLQYGTDYFCFLRLFEFVLMRAMSNEGRHIDAIDYKEIHRQVGEICRARGIDGRLFEARCLEETIVVLYVDAQYGSDRFEGRVPSEAVVEQEQNELCMELLRVASQPEILPIDLTNLEVFETSDCSADSGHERNGEHGASLMPAFEYHPPSKPRDNKGRPSRLPGWPEDIEDADMLDLTVESPPPPTRATRTWPPAEAQATSLWAPEATASSTASLMDRYIGSQSHQRNEAGTARLESNEPPRKKTRTDHFHSGSYGRFGV